MSSSAGNVNEGNGVKTEVGLKKNIGILQGVSIVIGIIVGSGIFVSPVGVLKQTNSVGLSFVMWVVTGLFSTLGALVYADLGVLIPRSGGEYVYILESFGSFLAFFALWIIFVVIGTVSCAVNSIVLAQYVLQPFFPTCPIPGSVVRIVAILALLTICFINCYRVTWATRLAIVFTACKVAALLLIIGFGMYYLAIGNTSSFEVPFENSNFSLGSGAAAFYQGFWAFAGWNYLNYLTGELKNAERNLRIVIIISLTAVTSLYILVNVAYMAVLSPYEILLSGEGSAAVAVTFASRCMGVMSFIMPVFVGASVFGSVNSEVLSISRLPFTAGEEGHMPAFMSMVSVTNLTPIPSVLAVILIALVFQFYDNIFYLIELTGLAFTVLSEIAVLTLFYFRRKKPELVKSVFQLPIIFPIIYLIFNFLIGVFSIYNEPRNAILSLGLILSGLPVYIIFIAWKNKPTSFKLFTYKLTIFIQRLLYVVPQNATPGCVEIDQPEDNGVEHDPQDWPISPTP